MSAQRKTNTARWSAKSTLTAMDAEGQKVPLGDPSTIKVVARWRYDGKGRKMVFSGPNAGGDAAGFQGLLLGAAHKDWPADTRGRPIVPDWATGTVLTAPANETPPGLRSA